jgi:hypothetical protein
VPSQRSDKHRLRHGTRERLAGRSARSGPRFGTRIPLRNVSARRYGVRMTAERSWSDEDLHLAVARASSWRGVMRELVLNPNNGGVTKTIRSHSSRMGLDTSHFRSNRSWSDGQLREALTESRTWDEVLVALGRGQAWHRHWSPREADRTFTGTAATVT